MFGLKSKRKLELGDSPYEFRDTRAKSSHNSLFRSERDRLQLKPMIKNDAENVSNALTSDISSEKFLLTSETRSSSPVYIRQEKKKVYQHRQNSSKINRLIHQAWEQFDQHRHPMSRERQRQEHFVLGMMLVFDGSATKVHKLFASHSSRTGNHSPNSREQLHDRRGYNKIPLNRLRRPRSTRIVRLQIIVGQHYRRTSSRRTHHRNF